MNGIPGQASRRATRSILSSLCLVAVVAGASGLAQAQGKPEGSMYEVPPLDRVPMFTDRPVRYNRNEAGAVAMSRELQRRPLTPARAGDGSVRFVFGQATPTVVCSPLRICVVSLEPGEKVQDVIAGDTARWKIEPSISGVGEALTYHAVLKPTDVGLDTNLMITTDRRVYHLTLKSARHDYMPSISFEYPDNDAARWRSIREHERAREQAALELRAKGALPGIGLNVADLHFNYDISSNFAWKPLRVFDDGVRTYVELPAEVVAREAPIVLTQGVQPDEVVNYRLTGNRYIIDRLADTLTLVQGVGRNQQRITIRRSPAKGEAHHAASDPSNDAYR